MISSTEVAKVEGFADIIRIILLRVKAHLLVELILQDVGNKVADVWHRGSDMVLCTRVKISLISHHWRIDALILLSEIYVKNCTIQLLQSTFQTN